jgi:hypothetical protein
VLRHSFISYRIAIVQSADQVALEAGNSVTIIFKHYRELTTPEVAKKWFSILPKDPGIYVWVMHAIAPTRLKHFCLLTNSESHSSCAVAPGEDFSGLKIHPS